MRSENDPTSSNFKGNQRRERGVPRDPQTGLPIPYPQGSGMEHLNTNLTSSYQAHGIRSSDDPNSSGFKGIARRERGAPRDPHTGLFLPYPAGSGMEHKNAEIHTLNNQLMGKSPAAQNPGYTTTQSY